MFCRQITIHKCCICINLVINTDDLSAIGVTVKYLLQMFVFCGISYSSYWMTLSSVTMAVSYGKIKHGVYLRSLIHIDLLLFGANRRIISTWTSIRCHVPYDTITEYASYKKSLVRDIVTGKLFSPFLFYPAV